MFNNLKLIEAFELYLNEHSKLDEIYLKVLPIPIYSFIKKEIILNRLLRLSKEYEEYMNNYKIQKVSFVQYLKNIHAKDYIGTDDDMPDSFEIFLNDLDIDDFIKYGDQAIETQIHICEKKNE